MFLRLAGESVLLVHIVSEPDADAAAMSRIVSSVANPQTENMLN
jgi:hypothetical protein